MYCNVMHFTEPCVVQSVSAVLQLIFICSTLGGGELPWDRPVVLNCCLTHPQLMTKNHDPNNLFHLHSMSK